MFRQPTFQKNALHEYLDNEDAATSTDAAAAGGFGGEGGWGEKGAGHDEQEEEEDQEMKVVRLRVLHGWRVGGLERGSGVILSTRGRV